MPKGIGYSSPLAALIGATPGKKTTPKEKVSGMRGYTAGRSISDFIAAQSDSPFLRSLYAYTKTMRQRKDMKGQKGKEETDAPTESGENEPQKRTGIQTIKTFRRQLKTVEKVTAETQKDTKEVIKAIAEIKKGILGIRSAIQKFKGSLDKITSSITPSPETSLAGSAAKIYDTAGADTKELLKPIDVKSSEGDEYMYYRGAPQGRQFYKKGKSGAAGAVASKEMAQELYASLEKKLSEVSAKMNGGIDETGKMLPSKDYGTVKEVDDKEETEKLEKALEGALRKVLPNALSQSGFANQSMASPTTGGTGPGLLDTVGLAATGLAATAYKKVKDLGKRAYQGVKNLGSKIGGLMRGGAPAVTPTMPTTGPVSTPTTVPTTEAAKQAAQQTAGATATKGATAAGETAATKAAEKAGTKSAAKIAGKTALKSIVKKIPLIGALAGLGFGAQRALGGDYTGAALEVGSGIAGTLPGLGTAASLGMDATLAARDMGAFNTATPNRANSDLPATIVERSSANLQAARNVQPPIIVNAPSTTQAPPPPPTGPKPVEFLPTIRNPDDAFMRATARDFFHPSSVYK